MDCWAKKIIEQFNMTIQETKLKGVYLLQPRVFKDDRGFFYESYRKSMLQEVGIELNFVQDNVSKSAKNTIRGLHYQIQKPQDKLVSCLVGKVLDVAVDIRRDSPTFGESVAFELSEDNHYSLLVPKGFAHGFSVLTKEAVISYKCSDYYHKEGERGIFWNDKNLNIDWMVNDPILSDKDKQLPMLSELNKEDLF